MTREETTIHFAAAMGWKVNVPDYKILTLYWFSGPNSVPFTLPPAGAPQRDHAKFAAAVAESLGDQVGFIMRWRPWLESQDCRSVIRFIDRAKMSEPEEMAADLSWAAMKAAIVAKAAWSLPGESAS